MKRSYCTFNMIDIIKKTEVDKCKGPATRNDIVDDIVDFSSSTMAFNVAKIA